MKCNVPEKTLIKLQETGFDGEAHCGAGTKVFGGFEKGCRFVDKFSDLIAVGSWKSWLEVVDATKQVVVDSIVRGVMVAGAVKVLRHENDLI